MAILFFEGLPRAGKSYEAMSTQIIPWLKRDRHVVAYIEGLNFERIAEAAELPVERVRELLHPLTREDMTSPGTQKGKGRVEGPWLSKTMDNALHVFDEAQNWWPVRMQPSPELTQFITEHGHRGMTVLLMGQSLRDVHALWRRRVDQKFVFLKLTALGQAKRYRVTIQKGQGDDRFVKVSDRVCKYDEKFFGTYASHVGEGIDTDTYTDKRVNFLRAWARWAVPVMLVLGLWGGYKLWRFFHPAELVGSAQAATVAQPGAPRALPGAAVVGPPVKTRVVPVQEKYFSDLSSKYRVRLVGFIRRGKDMDGVVEWIDGGAHVMDRMRLVQLRDLAVSITVVGDALILKSGDWQALATMWPIESEGRVSEDREAGIRRAGGVDRSGTPPPVEARPAPVRSEVAEALPVRHERVLRAPGTPLAFGPR